MNEAQLQEAVARIVNDPKTTEVIYKQKIVDEYGEQSLVAKREYILDTEVIEETIEYEGNTTNFKTVGISRILLVNSKPIEIVPQIVVKEPNPIVIDDKYIISPEEAATLTKQELFYHEKLLADKQRLDMVRR